MCRLPYPLSLRNSDLPNFGKSDTLYKSSFGWHYEAYCSVCLPPSHLRRVIKNWDWKIQDEQDESTIFVELSETHKGGLT